MSDFEELDGLPEDFSNTVRLFPLPNLVMFPNVMQPLHIFEPRYLEMLEAALQDDGIIAMVLLEPGWEADYDARPAVAPVACVGRVVSHCPTEDGQQNILLLGLKRAAIARELPPTHAFRQADIMLLEDHYPAAGAATRPALERQLLQSFRDLVPPSGMQDEQFEQLLSSQIPLGMLTDIISFTVSFPLALKQQLLSDWNVDERARRLLEELRRKIEQA